MFPLYDDIPARRFPWMTWGLIVANVIVFGFQLTLSDRQLEILFQIFAIVPRRFVHPEWALFTGLPAGDFLPFLTYQFLHGGWFHLILNMWTLWIFGNNVEDAMGPIRFLTFYLICGMVAGVAHLLTNPMSVIPAVGASGAIAGVLGAYFRLYPLARVICVVPVFFYPLLIGVPAFFYLLLWFWSQFFSGALSLLQPGQAGGIAWWAHIGGFVAGLFAHPWFIIWRPPPAGWRPARQPGRRW